VPPGTTVRAARNDLEASTAIRELPATLSALAASDVSLAQAAEVARAEERVPGSEAGLLDLARRSGLGRVRDEARKIVLGALPDDELVKRRQDSRYFSHWVDRDGMVRLSGALPPGMGVGLMNRLDTEAHRLRRSATKKERFEAHAADALVALLRGRGQGHALKAEVVLLLDTRAYWRGHRHPGELCNLVGGGVVDVEWAKQMMSNAFVKAVVHDGERIQRVAHFGRYMKAELRTALELGAPPDFDGPERTGLSCERRHNLEWDHVDPVANNGPTSYENLRAKCKPHHREKTEQDRQAGLLDPHAHGRPSRRRTAGGIHELARRLARGN